MDAPLIQGNALPLLQSVPAFFHQLPGAPAQRAEAEPYALCEGNGYIKGCKVLNTVALAQEEVREIIQILHAQDSYGDPYMGARCFLPGFAFTFGSGPEQVHIQICLKCSWFVFHAKSGCLHLVPSERGKNLMRTIYQRHVQNK